MTPRAESHGGDCWTSASQDRWTAVCLAAPVRCLGENISECLKVVMVQKGITDDALNTQVVLRASRTSNFQLVREEASRGKLLAKDPCRRTSALAMRRAGGSRA